ncbi:hypothetical protein GF402_02240 [Candidatus Fermentibacteria bacterium]|nr:hypothetical protein [Candidatus Fermentibacteria bacterium]
MLSDKLSSLAEVERIVLEVDDYLLARVRGKDREYLAELIPDEGRPDPEWPSVRGVTQPLACKKVKGVSLRIFKPHSGRVVLEDIRERPYGEKKAFRIVLDLIPILYRLHESGMVPGYLGPENVLVTGEGETVMLAGARGNPDLPFTAPESVGTRTTDPRSSVFALGTFLFRMIAGSDDRDIQIEKWNQLSEQARTVLEELVAAEPEARIPNLSMLSQEIESFLESPSRSVYAPSAKPAPGGPPERGDREAGGEGSGFDGRKVAYGPPRRKKPRKRTALWVVVLLAIVAAAVFVIWPFHGSDGSSGPEDVSGLVVEDTSGAGGEAVVDSGEVADTGPGPVEVSVSSDVVTIWLSNMTGTAGNAREYRGSFLSDYSHVYPSYGGEVLDDSLLLVRRRDIRRPLSEQPEWPLVRSITSADSSLSVLPVDVSLVLGRDLSYAGINEGFLAEPVAPAGTIYVEVINQGLQYTLEGLPPSQWVSSVVDGRSLTHDDREWLLKVVQTRKGDSQPNPELGMQAVMDSTAFLYRPGIEVCVKTEESIRSLLQALSPSVEGPPSGIPVPDIWILLGS